MTRARAVLSVALAAGLAACEAPPPAPLDATPEALARGRKVFADRCLHCHADVPLRHRVAGWPPERAYEAIGRLPEISAAMPRFAGTDDDRRALAVFLAALGEGRAP